MERKNAQAIGDIIDEYLKSQHLDLKINETRILSAWPVIMGKAVASYTTRAYIHNRMLYVHLSSAVLRNELFVNRHSLVKRLNQHVGSEVITSIIFR